MNQSRQSRDRSSRSHATQPRVRDREIIAIAPGREDLEQVLLGNRRFGLAELLDRFPTDLPGAMFDERAEHLGIPFDPQALHEFRPGQTVLNPHGLMLDPSARVSRRRTPLSASVREITWSGWREGRVECGHPRDPSRRQGHNRHRAHECPRIRASVVFPDHVFTSAGRPLLAWRAVRILIPGQSRPAQNLCERAIEAREDIAAWTHL